MAASSDLFIRHPKVPATRIAGQRLKLLLASGSELHGYFEPVCPLPTGEFICQINLDSVPSADQICGLVLDELLFSRLKEVKSGSYELRIKKGEIERLWSRCEPPHQ